MSNSLPQPQQIPKRRNVQFNHGNRYERPYNAELEGGDNIEVTDQWQAHLYLTNETLSGYDKSGVIVLENNLEADCQILGTIPPATTYYVLSGLSAAHEPIDED